MPWDPRHYASEETLQILADAGDPFAAQELRVRAIHWIGRQYNHSLRAYPMPEPLTRHERFNGSLPDSFAA